MSSLQSLGVIVSPADPSSVTHVLLFAGVFVRFNSRAFVSLLLR